MAGGSDRGRQGGIRARGTCRARTHPMTALVTGGAGFIGANLAARLLREGQLGRIVDNISRAGVEGNLAWLRERHGARVEVMVGDVCEPGVAMSGVRGVDSVYHLAAQVAV